MDRPDAPYFRTDLARVHHRGFGFHADGCAPGILALLEPIQRRDGVVLPSFGSYELPDGLVAVVGTRRLFEARPSTADLGEGTA